MSAIEIFGTLVQTPAGQGLLALWSLLAGGIAWLVKSWALPSPRQRQSLVYTGLTHRVVAPEKFGISGLEVFVDGVKQRQVAVTKVALWNHGSATIREGDIAPTDQLRFKISEGVQILSAEVVLSVREASRVRLEMVPDSQEISIRFDFLAKGDGAVMRLVHNGSPRTTKLALKGTLVEGTPIRHVTFEDARYAERAVISSLKSWKAIDMALVLVAVTLMYAAVVWTFDNNSAVFFVSAFTSGPAVLFAWRLLRPRWRRLYPSIPEAFVPHVNTAISLESLSEPETSTESSATSPNP